MFRYSELKKQENDTDSSNFFLIISIFPNLIQLFVSSWSDLAQEDAAITDQLHTHTC